MEIKDFINFAKSLGISTEGQLLKNYYVIKLEDSDDYAHHYTLLSNSAILNLEETTSLDEEEVELVYLSNKYKTSLIADFNKDNYRIIIEKIKVKDKETIND